MSRAGILITLGVLTALAPFSGLPIALRSLLSVCFGVCVFGVGLSLRVRDTQNARSSAPAGQPDPMAAPQSPRQESSHGVSPI